MLADKSGLRPKGHGKASRTEEEIRKDNSLVEYNRKVGERLRQRTLTPEQRASIVRDKIEQNKQNINNGITK